MGWEDRCDEEATTNHDDSTTMEYDWQASISSHCILFSELFTMNAGHKQTAAT